MSRSSRLPQTTPPLPRAAALVTLVVAAPAVAATLVTTWSPCASVCPGLTLITAASVLTPPDVAAAPLAAPPAMPDAAAGGPWLNSAPPPGGVTDVGPVVPLGVPPLLAEPSPAVHGVCADSVCGVGPAGVGVALGVLLGALVVLGPGLGVLESVVDPFAPTWSRVPGAVRHTAQCSSRHQSHHSCWLNLMTSVFTA